MGDCKEFRRWKIATFSKVYKNKGRNIVRLAPRLQTYGKVRIILEDYKNLGGEEEYKKITRIKKDYKNIERLQESRKVRRILKDYKNLGR